MAWGPIFYRGRLDGSAKVIVIGQDPAPDEDVARRILVGDAGQRVQGFLRKLGLVRAYVMVNTFLYGIKGQIDQQAKQISASANIKDWRNQLLDMLLTPKVEAIIAFGAGAQQVVDLWPGSAGHLVARLTHPSARDDAALLQNWNQGLPQLLQQVTPDPGGAPSAVPYGTAFTPADIAPIPARDLAFGVPKWLGNGDTAVRAKGQDWITWKPTAPEG
jgi:uracil-DNA glycosylase